MERLRRVDYREVLREVLRPLRLLAKVKVSQVILLLVKAGVVELLEVEAALNTG